MRRIRFTISSLLIVVLFAGLGFAALREANEIWDSSIFSTTVGILVISTLPAVHRTEKRRAFWLGFALFGWIYLGLSLVPSIESRLTTTRTLTYLDSKMPRSSPVELTLELSVNNGNGTFEDVPTMTGWRSSKPSKPWPPSVLTGFSGTTGNFIRIGHSLLALIMALLGGYISRYHYASNREVIEETITSQGSISPQRSGR